MEDNDNIKQHTYDNWRIVTNADFVTLFIKTWFSFVATLRELYSDNAKPYYEAAGDKPYLSQYEKEFSGNYYFLLKYGDVEEALIRTYRHGFNIICEKYPRFLIDDFHRINTAYKESYKEDFLSPGGFSGSIRLAVRSSKDNIVKASIICTDKVFLSKSGDEPVIVSAGISIDEILEQIISIIEAKHQSIAETGLLVTFYQVLFQRITSNLVDAIEEKKNRIPDKGNKQIKLVYSIMQSFCFRASENLKKQCMDSDISDEHKIMTQMPTFEFTQSTGTLSFSEEQRAYLWFVRFAYRLRNALFHEIIDPLDASWQLIFQNAYLILKHIVEANVARLKMCDLLKENAKLVFENDFRNAPPPDIPIERYYDTSFLFDQVILKYYNDTGAKVFISSTIICNGISYKVECNVKWDSGLNNPKVKNVLITKLEEKNNEVTEH